MGTSSTAKLVAQTEMKWPHRPPPPKFRSRTMPRTDWMRPRAKAPPWRSLTDACVNAARAGAGERHTPASCPQQKEHKAGVALRQKRGRVALLNQLLGGLF